MRREGFAHRKVVYGFKNSKMTGSLLSSLLVGAAVIAIASPIHAQETESAANAEDSNVEEEDENLIVVTGIRQTIQDSIQTKRNSVEIVEALSSEEIGDLPALSIGEALETLTSAASHREQGGATEISLRGLGPFLSSTVINGRSATNGSGDRSVNFSQFPSELFNKLAVYKSQSASMIEGGVAGQITLETVKPLDYGKRRIQGEIKLNYNPSNDKIDAGGLGNDIGYRGTVSYVDQYDLGGLGQVGLSIGYQRNESTNPEQEARSSSEYRDCRYDPSNTSAGVFDDGNCDSGRGDLVLEIDPATGTAPDAGADFILAPSTRAYRQNITKDVRDAFFSALQWQPSPDVDINLDFQYSNRVFEEARHDLVFAENRRIDGEGDINRLDYDLLRGRNGEVYQFTSEQRLESHSEYLSRAEKYYGGGASIAVQASERLRLSVDGSYSQTQRIEVGIQTRLQSEGRDIFGETVPFTPGFESDGTRRTDRPETATLIGRNGSQIFNFVTQEFDVNNYDLFADQARTRYDLEQDRFNSILAFRGDVQYEFGGGLLQSIEAGARYQELKYRAVPGAVRGSSRIEETYSDAALAAANQACRIPFPERDFLSSVSGGNPLVTIVDTDGNVISTTNTYAAFDPLCLPRSLEENDPSGNVEFDVNGFPTIPDGSFNSIRNNDVNERTWAGYVQANFDGDLGTLPVRGNIGLRIVNSRVRSTGFRGALTATALEGGGFAIAADNSDLTEIVGGGSYTEFLPSFNFTADVGQDILARFAFYRALSRPDPSALGYGRTFSASTDEDATSIADIVGNAVASGNPFTRPLLSWNFDVALEWYPNSDTILAVGAYYKIFNGGFENTSQIEQFSISGTSFDTIVTTTDTTGENSTIFGLEATAAHRFSWLPAPLDGLGFKISYNYASSNFEFEDGNLGAATQIRADGTAVQRIGILPPAEIFGLSKHVLSAQLYYQIGGLDFQGIYKYRSRYFQQYVSTPDRIRYVGAAGVFEARISYKITKNIKITIEGINLFNEPRRQYVGTTDNIGEVNVYGPRYYAGVKIKF